MASAMKAWQYTAISGQLENSIIMTTSVTPPAESSLTEGQALIEVITAAINPVEYKMPELPFIGKRMISPPAIPGLDFCGRVVAVNPSDDALKIGQLVFGSFQKARRFGSLGQFTIASKDEFASLPKGVDQDQAAAAGRAALAAYQSIPPQFIKAGSKVFINGGSGGTGTFGIQFAKVLGAEVTVTCSTDNVELCKNLGADTIIDYRQSDVISELTKKGPVYDLVVDNVGTPGNLYESSTKFLRPHGKFIQIGVEMSFSGVVTMFIRSLRPSFFRHREYQFLQISGTRKDFAQIGQLLADGKIKSVIDGVFEWEDAPRAYAKLRTGRTKGKIVVHVTEK